VFVSVAVWGSAATANADVNCDGQARTNPAAPESYQEQYNPSVAKPLTKDLATDHSAVASGDPKQIGEAAGTLYSEISFNPKMFGTQTLFGCYSPAVLASLQQATDTLAPTYETSPALRRASAGRVQAMCPVSFPRRSREKGLHRRAQRLRLSVRRTTGPTTIIACRSPNISVYNARSRACFPSSDHIARSWLRKEYWDMTVSPAPLRCAVAGLYAWAVLLRSLRNRKR
jgi:hypothetical protein